MDRKAVIVADYLAGLTWSEIRSRHGASNWTIARALRDAGIETSRIKRSGVRRKRADLIEDVEWLLDDGARLTTILARLEMKRDSLHRALTRAGRLDLYWRAADREDDAEMRRKVSEANRRRRAAA